MSDKEAAHKSVVYDMILHVVLQGPKQRIKETPQEQVSGWQGSKEGSKSNYEAL